MANLETDGQNIKSIPAKQVGPEAFERQQEL